jgi:hypothetical protein
MKPKITKPPAPAPKTIKPATPKILNKHPEYVATGYGQTITHKGHKLFGWGFAAPAFELYKKAILPVKNGIIIEIGVYGGASILPIEDICLTNNNKIYGIDPWEDQNFSIVNGLPVAPERIAEMTKNLKYARLNLEDIIAELNYKNITLLKSTSKIEINKFENNSVDLVFIDGDHSYNFVYNDMSSWIEKIKPGCTLCGDDFGWATVKAAVVDFCNKNKLKYTVAGGKWFTTKPL